MAVEAGCRSWDDGIHTLLTAYPPALHNRKLFSLPLYANVLSMVADGTGQSGITNSNTKKFPANNPRGPLRSVLRIPRKRVTKTKKEKTSRKKLTTMFELLKVKPELMVARDAADKQ